MEIVYSFLWIKIYKDHVAQLSWIGQLSTNDIKKGHTKNVVPFLFGQKFQFSHHCFIFIEFTD